MIPSNTTPELELRVLLTQELAALCQIATRVDGYTTLSQSRAIADRVYELLSYLFPEVQKNG